MKLSTLIPAVNVLAIAVPAAFLLFTALKKSDVIAEFNPNFSTELKSLRLELNNLKRVGDELPTIKQKVASLEQATLKQGSVKLNQLDTEAFQTKDKALPDDPKIMQQKFEEQNTKSLETMNKALLAEAGDSQWANETTETISGFFDTEEGAKLNVSDIQCRKTLCKIELSKVDKLSGAGSLSLQFAMHVGGVLPQTRYFYEENEDGTSNVTIFLARKGFGLPEENETNL